MNESDPIERAMSGGPVVEPSPGFTHRVMREVHRVADEPEPIAFPILPFAAGVGGILALLVLALWVAASGANAGVGPTNMEPIALSRASTGVLIAVVSVVGSLWAGYWFAFPNRRTAI